VHFGNDGRKSGTLGMKEREQVLTAAVRVCKGKMPIMADAGTIDPAHVPRRMTMQAIDLGVDCLAGDTLLCQTTPQSTDPGFSQTADYGLPLVVSGCWTDHGRFLL
jgi:hypothetical protein